MYQYYCIFLYILVLMKFVHVDAVVPIECEQFPNTKQLNTSRRVLVMCGQSRVFMRLDVFFDGNIQSSRRLRPTPLFTIYNGTNDNMSAAQVLRLCDPDAYKNEKNKNTKKRRAFTCYMYVYYSGQWRVLYTMLVKFRRELLNGGGIYSMGICPASVRQHLDSKEPSFKEGMQEFVSLFL